MYKDVSKSLVGILLLCLSGCSGITDPQLVTSFDWTELEDSNAVTEGITTSVAYGDLFILGQLFAPAHCYELKGNFKESGNNLRLTVRARRTNSPNCDETQGGFKYTAVMSNLSFGVYNLTVTHDVEGGTGGTYTESVTIR